MLITITLNPSIDHAVVLDSLELGKVNRVKEARSDPGGKGINVSRVLKELGADSLAMGFVAGSIGRYIEASLNELGIADDFIHTPGRTRTNISILEANSRRQTSVNELGPPTLDRYAQVLFTRLARRVGQGDWVVLAGSAPPAIPHDIYAELIKHVVAQGGRAVLDADGDLLAQGVAARPYLIKPNLAELERLVKKPIGEEEEIILAAKDVQAQGIRYVVVSMGAQGAVAVGDGEVWRGFAPEIEALSTVGAGDSLVAGLVMRLAEGQGLAEALRLGMASGTATALTPGTMLCRRPEVERLLPLVRIERRD